MDELVKNLVTSLAPALPYLAIAGQKISEEIGQSLGKVVTEKAKKIWEILHYRIELNPNVKELAKNPDNQNAQKSFGNELKKLLENDDALTKQLQNLFHGKEECFFKQIINNDGHIEKQLIIQKVEKIEL